MAVFCASPLPCRLAPFLPAPQERNALTTILEQKMARLVDDISQQMQMQQQPTADMYSNNNSNSSSDQPQPQQVARQVALLQRLIHASVAALK